MKKTITPIFLIIISLFISCEKIEDKFNYLIGDKSLYEYFLLENDSISIFASPLDKKKNNVECKLYRDEYKLFLKMFKIFPASRIMDIYRRKGSSKFTPDLINEINSIPVKKFVPEGADGNLPLKGLRIALDPGHIAGEMEMAVLERKYIDMFVKKTWQIKFFEAKLNLETVKLLEKMLLKAGAEVFVTRETSGTVTGIDIKKWMKNDYRKAVKMKLKEKIISARKAKYLLRTRNKRARLKFFLSEFDRPARTDLINKFHPHLTLVIHYNTAGDLTGYKNKYRRINEIVGIRRMSDRRKIRMIRKVFGSISEIDKNYSLAFAPGCFAKNELRNIRFRMEFLRLLLSDDMKSSVDLSKKVINRFVKDLKVPAVGNNYNKSRYNKLTDTRGVYVRNLRMLTWVHGTVCLGEPFLQNNMKEALQLYKINNKKIPKRIKDSARAYYNAVIDYVYKKNIKKK